MPACPHPPKQGPRATTASCPDRLRPAPRCSTDGVTRLDTDAALRTDIGVATAGSQRSMGPNPEATVDGVACGLAGAGPGVVGAAGVRLAADGSAGGVAAETAALPPPYPARRPAASRWMAVWARGDAGPTVLHIAQLHPARGPRTAQGC